MRRVRGERPSSRVGQPRPSRRQMCGGGAQRLCKPRGRGSACQSQAHLDAHRTERIQAHPPSRSPRPAGATTSPEVPDSSDRLSSAVASAPSQTHTRLTQPRRSTKPASDHAPSLPYPEPRASCLPPLAGSGRVRARSARRRLATGGYSREVSFQRRLEVGVGLEKEPVRAAVLRTRAPSDPPAPPGLTDQSGVMPSLPRVKPLALK